MTLSMRAMEAWMSTVLGWLALPQFGLGAVFVVALVSATLLPLGSEPVVFGLVKLNAEMFWPAILVATLGNTAGGAISWWTGRAAAVAAAQVMHRPKVELRALGWLERFGPAACLASWLPGVGDPLCAVAGWLRMPLLACTGYMAAGKLARYVLMTTVLLHMI